ncbi:acyl-CoA transferase [Sulfurifustis variabilis]|uniref:Acyl-CoA transferase n=1 Tax=Sulfurifustis variabilis TaxID=1675686 RepID=A0A1B4V4V1_9GAMM|nr:CoA transferase [Sulfurifustis variabilis]BAU48559.1 acyl-CoA transferase [Sulfurifustis variabilis]
MNDAHEAGAPLRGVRIIDLTHEWAGPHAARLMADFGAEVIKVEYLKRLDHMRGARKQGRAYDRQTRFLQLNRNKRSVTLDLRDARDRARFEGLLRLSDAVISNSRPGVLERLRLGYDDLRIVKPDIILMSLSACGQTGPEASYAGYGGGLEATSGIQSLTGYLPEEEPRRIRELDVTNGIAAAAALMTALVRRQLTGHGTWIDLSEIEAPTHALIGEELLALAVNGEQRRPMGNRDARDAPHGCYPCQGDDAWVVIAVTSEDMWAAFCEAIGRRDWAEDRRFATRSGRMRHHDELDAAIAGWTGARSASEVTDLLQRAGVGAGPVMSVADLAEDPHLQARRYFQSADAGGPDLRFPGFPFRLSGGGAAVRAPGPALGEGNAYLRHDLLGAPPEAVPAISEDDIRTDFDLEGEQDAPAYAAGRTKI